MVFRQSSHHLQEAGKSYFVHGRFAVKAGFMLIFAGITSILHGLIPAVFPFLSRDIVLSLSEQTRQDRPGA
jgi:hypothetical protein